MQHFLLGYYRITQKQNHLRQWQPTAYLILMTSWTGTLVSFQIRLNKFCKMMIVDLKMRLRQTQPSMSDVHAHNMKPSPVAILQLSAIKNLLPKFPFIICNLTCQAGRETVVISSWSFISDDNIFLSLCKTVGGYANKENVDELKRTVWWQNIFIKYSAHQTVCLHNTIVIAHFLQQYDKNVVYNDTLKS